MAKTGLKQLDFFDENKDFGKKPKKLSPKKTFEKEINFGRSKEAGESCKYCGFLNKTRTGVYSHRYVCPVSGIEIREDEIHSFDKVCNRFKMEK